MFGRWIDYPLLPFLVDGKMSKATLHMTHCPVVPATSVQEHDRVIVELYTGHENTLVTDFPFIMAPSEARVRLRPLY